MDGRVGAMVLIVWMICSASLQNTIRPTGIVIHHSALTAEELAQFPGPTDVSVIDALHEKRGFEVNCQGHIYHIGYHYIILPDGTIQSGRPENCIGAHTQGHNDALGICLVGNFSSVANPDGKLGLLHPTPSQIDSLAKLVKDLRIRCGFTCDQIRRHQEIKPGTLCPGDRLNWRYIQAQFGCGKN
jgi:N-acetylmuramoyl-L-alanine amidase